VQHKITREKGKALIEFTIAPDVWNEAINTAYKKNAKRYKIDGFRKGGAPRKLIERFYGENVFFDDAFDDVARSSYVQVIQDNEDLFPVDAPQVTDINTEKLDTDGLRFTMSVELRPEVLLGKYKGIKVDQVEYTVKKTDIDKELELAQERASRTVPVEGRPVKNGDTIKLNYSGSVDGVKFDGGTAQDQTLVIGSGSFIEGFEPQLVGMNVGDEKNINVTFPVEYHSAELKGKAAVFNVKVLEIQGKELPKLDDQFAKDTTRFETLQEYKADIKDRLYKDNKRRADNENKMKMLDAICETTTVDIPNCMIEEELEGMLEEFSQRISHMYRGLKIEDYFKYTQSSVEDYKKDNRDQATNAVKTRLCMQEIIKAEKLDVSDSAVESHIKDLAKTRNKVTEKDVADFIAQYDANARRSVKSELTVEKLFEFLNKNNTLNVIVDPSDKPAKKETVKKAKEEKTEADEKPATKKAVAKKTATKKESK